MIIGCVEVGVRSAKVTSGSIVAVKDVNDTVAIGVVVSHISIVGNEASCRAGFNGIRDQVVIAIQIKVVGNAISIIINGNRSD